MSAPRTARVVTASNRAAAGVYPDRGGPLIVTWLRERGYETPDAAVVPDGDPVGEALRVAVAERVDVVITTGGTGISPTDATPDVRVLVLTTFDLDEYVYEALRAGASGFLLKDASADQLAEAVRVVAAGDALLAPGVTRRLIAEFSRLDARPRSPLKQRVGDLTERETEVLALIAQGLSNAEIAVRLVVAEQTVKTHVGRILVKLGLRDRTQAAVFAYESGLVRPSGY